MTITKYMRKYLFSNAVTDEISRKLNLIFTVITSSWPTGRVQRFGETADAEVPEMLDFGSELKRPVSRDFIPVIFRINVYPWKDSRKGYCNKLAYIARTKSRINSVGIES
jgi:hypothetical protein